MKQQPELTIYEIPTDDLIPYAHNAKTHSDYQVDTIVSSIEEFGNCDPIAVWHNAEGKPEIVEGHGRLLALKKLGIDTCPVIYLDHLSDEQRRAYTHVHNQTTLNSDFDFDILDQEIEELDLFDWRSFGFDVPEKTTFEEVIEDDAPENPEQRCKTGEVWILGAHRLMCGSATDHNDMDKLCGGGVINLLLTDPPYGVSYVGKTKDALTINNDSMEDEGFEQFLYDAFSGCMEHMAPGASFYVFYADSRGGVFRNACARADMVVRECLVWVKNTMVMGRQDYQWKHEPCLYGWKEGGAHSWYSDRKQTTVLEFDRPTRNAEHPTMKPVSLIAYLIQNSSKQGDVVLDCFGGSGSTLIACEQMGRTCYTMELDPHYCDVIIQRWEDLTGQKAVLA